MLSRLAKQSIPSGARSFFRVAEFPVGEEATHSVNAPLVNVLNAHPAHSEATLNNGLRVVSENIGGKTATIGLYIQAGSRYEADDENGVAHFVERMLFKGTTNRSRVQLEKEIEAIGAQFSSSTGRELSHIKVTVPKEHIAKALDILGDMICNSTFDPATIEAEREVILRELQEISPEQHIIDEMYGMAFKNQPLGRSPIGNAFDVKHINKHHIEQYVRAHFFGPRLSLVATGNVNHNEIVQQADKIFGSVIPAESDSVVPPVKGSAYFLGSMVHMREDDMPYVHFGYGYETNGWNDPDTFPLLCYEQMIGSFVYGDTAAIHSPSLNVADISANHLLERFRVIHDTFSDTGIFGLYMVADAVTSHEGPRIAAEHFLFPTYDCSPEMLESAKNGLKTKFFSKLTSSSELCDEIGTQLSTIGRRIHPLESLQRIDEVDVVAINNVGKRFLYDTDPVVAVTGPSFEVQPYEWWRRRSFTHRQ